MIKLSRRLSVALLAMLCMPVVSMAAAEEYPNRPICMVDRDIRPVGTGTWSLPPFPHAEPNFRKLALETKGIHETAAG